MNDYYSAPYGRAKSLNQQIKIAKEAANKRPPLITQTHQTLRDYLLDLSDLSITMLKTELDFVISDLNLNGFIEACESNYNLDCPYFKLSSKTLLLTSKLAYTWHTYCNNKPDRRKPFKRITPEIFGLGLGLNSLYSTRQDFDDLLAITLAANDRDYCREFVSYKNNTYIFMIMLATDFAGLPQRNWDHYLNPEPFLTQVLDHWADEDPTAYLNELLVQLCNRHTHHTRAATEKNPHDFAGPVLAHIPIEVLMIERLRQWKGLSPVSVDHKLMQTGLAKLPGEVESKWGDLLDKVWARVVDEHSDYKNYLEEAKRVLHKTDLEIEAYGFGQFVDERHSESIPNEVFEWAAGFDHSNSNSSPLLPLFDIVLTDSESRVAHKFISLCKDGGQAFIKSPLSGALAFKNDSKPLEPEHTFLNLSISLGWALDLNGWNGNMIDYLIDRLTAFGIKIPEDIFEIEPPILGPNVHKHDIYFMHIKRANEVLEPTGFKLIEVDIGSSQYITFLSKRFEQLKGEYFKVLP